MRWPSKKDEDALVADLKALVEVVESGEFGEAVRRARIPARPDGWPAGGDGGGSGGDVSDPTFAAVQALSRPVVDPVGVQMGAAVRSSLELRGLVRGVVKAVRESLDAGESKRGRVASVDGCAEGKCEAPASRRGRCEACYRWKLRNGWDRPVPERVIQERSVRHPDGQ